MANQITPLRHRNLIVVATAVVLAALGLIWAKAHAGATNNEFRLSVAQTFPAYRQRVRFWIHGDGIRPRIVHAKPGAILLTCENKTLLDAELVVERASANQIVQTVGAFGVSGSLGKATQEVLLTPGDYVVYERSRPEMKATLVVSP